MNTKPLESISAEAREEQSCAPGATEITRQQGFIWKSIMYTLAAVGLLYLWGDKGCYVASSCGRAFHGKMPESVDCR